MDSEGIVKTSLNVREELWTALAVRAAELKIPKGQAVEDAIRAWVDLPPAPEPTRPKKLREMHDALDALYSEADNPLYALQLRIVHEVLRTTREQLRLK